VVRVKRAALSSQVVDTIGGWILTGEVPAGKTLPSEQSLSEQFGVSKTVVREAMKILAAKGLVTVRQGIGTSVNLRDDWHPYDPFILLHSGQGTSFADLIQLRQIIEPEVAAMACVRSRDRGFLDQLAELARKGGEVTTVEDHVRYDLDFHQALAEATGNQLLVIMMNSIGQFLRASRQALFQVPGAVQRSSDFHQEIYNAIKADDPEASRDAMRRHLLQVEEDSRRLATHEQRPHPLDASAFA
jgi:GntR family transcriptional repressor for pyruvate dehydrogenase complex